MSVIKVVNINKLTRENDLLMIGIEELREAQKVLNYSAFKLYLYLASNSDKEEFELNQKEVENAIGIKKTAYHEGVRKLKELGYLVEKQGDRLDFFTRSVRFSGGKNKDEGFCSFE